MTHASILEEVPLSGTGEGYRKYTSTFAPLLAVLGLLVTAVFFVSCGGGGSGTSSSDPAPSGEDTSEGGAEELGPPALGDADAPVVMVEYGDYQ